MANKEKQTNSKNRLLIILGIVLVLLAATFGIIFVVNKNNEKKSISATATDEVTFTLNIQNTTTDSATDSHEYTVTKTPELQSLGDFLVSEDLVTGESSEYGLFITAVNNVPNANDAYWMIYVDGQLASTGADQIILQTGAVYELRLEAYVAQQSDAS